MNAEVVLFFIFAVVALVGALSMVAARNPVYSAMGLLASMFSLAIFYIMNGAHFVAAVQVLIYAGAVMTLFLFVIMLIGVDRTLDETEQIPLQRPLALGLGVGLVALMAIAGRAAWVTGTTSGVCSLDCVGTIENISDELFRAWILPFEATTLLLTIAAVGTIALGKYAPTPRPVESEE